MIKKLCCISLIYLFVSGCGCRDDGFESYELTEFERGIIPFVTEQSVEYRDQSNNLFSGFNSAKIEENQGLNNSDDESCMLIVVETQRHLLRLMDYEDEFVTYIGKNASNDTTFNVIVNRIHYSTLDCDNQVQSIETPTTDYSSDGFTFEDVYVLEFCNPDSPLSNIVYSLENGIEFIKYEDGNYLKLSS